jgi:molecular chaperone HscC
VEVRFTYDTSGLLEVDAIVLSTGAQHHLLIEGNPGRLSPAEIGQRLAALAHLKISPRDQAENVAALARAERLFEELLGEQRIAVGEWISQFLAALDAGDPRLIGASRALLLQRLDQAEPKSPFD